VVGDGCCGKTSLVITYCKGTFPAVYIPTVFENSCTQIPLPAHHASVSLDVWDTSGQEGYDRLRPLLYLDSSVVAVCFSTVNPDSFDNAKEFWIPEIRFYLPKVPIVLVGCQADLKQDEGTLSHLRERHARSVTEEEARRAVEDLGLFKYHETSSLKGEGLQELFASLALASLQGGQGKRQRKKPKRKMCLIQ